MKLQNQNDSAKKVALLGLAILLEISYMAHIGAIPGNDLNVQGNIFLQYNNQLFKWNPGNYASCFVSRFASNCLNSSTIQLQCTQIYAIIPIFIAIIFIAAIIAVLYISVKYKDSKVAQNTMPITIGLIVLMIFALALVPAINQMIPASC